MNKKILLGSLIAVVVLIGVSFTSVVGFRSVVSDVKASPLFNIRNSGAIDEESEDIVCEYVGKGENINLLIPNQVGDIGLLRKFVEQISIMDDKTFNDFIKYAVSRMQNNDRVKEIMTVLINLRNQPLKQSDY